MTEAPKDPIIATALMLGVAIGGAAVLLGAGLYIDGFDGAEGSDLAIGVTTIKLLSTSTLFVYPGLSVVGLTLGYLAKRRPDGTSSRGPRSKQAAFALFVGYAVWLATNPTVDRWTVCVPAGLATGLWILIRLVLRAAARRKGPGLGSDASQRTADITHLRESADPPVADLVNKAEEEPHESATHSLPLVVAGSRERTRWADRTSEQRIGIAAIAVTIIIGIAQIVASVVTAK